MLRDPPHYLRALTSTTVPERLLWLDCAADTKREMGAWVDRWSWGCMGATWRTSRRGELRDKWTATRHPGPLWDWADEFCRPGKRTVLWAHDLAYQLRVSGALVELPRLGWRIDRIVLERTASWALFRHGNRSLMCCDLASWAPSWAPPDADPTVRAQAVRDAVLDILRWIKHEQLGPFRPTGSGQSYAAFRRRFLTHNVLVHDDVNRLELERAAMWTGRCEAWRHGSLTGGPFIEYDLRAAYCQIAAECEVPVIAGRPISNPADRTLSAMLDRGAVLAECQLSTETPVVPTRLGQRTVWPVGNFRTVLWDPELRLALEHGEQVKVTRAWPYHTAPALQAFARYTLGHLDGWGSQGSDLPTRVAKHWSRCLVGRLGLRYRQWQRFGTCPTPDLRLVTLIDTEAGTSTDLLCAGRDRLILTGMVEGLDSLPQIPGWVMSECRARLWTAMQTVGLDHVLYVDTDSIIVGPVPDRPLMLGPDWWQAHGWSAKGRYARMTIYGPRNLVTQDSRKVAGLPLSARQVAPLEFTGQVMRSIKESMRAGQLDHVASLPRRFVLDAPDLRREHHPGGMTAPYRIEQKQPTRQEAEA